MRRIKKRCPQRNLLQRKSSEAQSKGSPKIISLLYRGSAPAPRSSGVHYFNYASYVKITRSIEHHSLVVTLIRAERSECDVIKGQSRQRNLYEVKFRSGCTKVNV